MKGILGHIVFKRIYNGEILRWMGLNMRNLRVFMIHNINYVYAILTWLAMLSIYWYLDYRVYGRNLNLGFMYVLIYPPMFTFFYYLYDEDRKESIKKQTAFGKRISNIITYIIFITFGIVLLKSILLKNPYQIKSYQILSAILFLAMISFLPQFKQKEQIVSNKESAKLISILIVIEILVVLIFCIIVSPMTVKEGQRLVVEIGYEDVEYIVNIKDPVILRTAAGDKEVLLSELEDSMNFYLYRGIKNGEEYGIIVSLIGHRIVAETNAEGNNTLLFYFNK